MSAEHEPSLTLNIGGKRTVEMTPANAQMYTFLGSTAVEGEDGPFEIDNSSVNHVWVQTAENKGMYFFTGIDKQFDRMARFMIEHQFPMVLNQREVPPQDLQAWLVEVEKITTDFSKKIPKLAPKT